MNNKGQTAGGVVAVGVGIVVLLVIAIIVGTVEDGITFKQTLSTTIGAYLEPLVLLSGLAMAGYMGYKAMR